MNRLRQRLRAFGPAAPLLVAAMAVPLLGTAVLAATAPRWLPWVGDGPGSASCFVALGALATAGCLLPTHATSLLAGFLFGAGTGSLLAWLLIVIGAALGHTLFRRLVGERATRALADSPRALVVHRALLGRGFWRTVWLVALLRLSPVMPFGATNLLCSALGVGLPAVLVATMLGITPRAVGAAVIGAGLSELDWGAGGSVWSTGLAIVATVLAVVVIGRAARRALRQATTSPATGGRPPGGYPWRD